MRQYFEYEPTQVPTALFKYSKMRKSNKSSLAAILRKGVPFVAEVRGAKTSSEQYVTYVRERYGTSMINGYLQGPSTKDHEHVHRSKNMTANIQLCLPMIAQEPQQSFLSNEINMDVL